ncbi:hypothetical protein FQN49_002766, partial [Arthroderma sp. PD_2]
AQLADRTLEAENLQSLVREKELAVSGPKEEPSRDSGDQRVTAPSVPDAEALAVEAMYDAFLAEKDDEIKALAGEKESLQLELERRAQQVQSMDKQLLEQASRLEQYRVTETREPPLAIAGARDEDTIMDGAIDPAAPTVGANSTDRTTELQEQLAASHARVSALGEEVAFANAALESKQGELDSMANQIKLDRANLVQQYETALKVAISQRAAKNEHKFKDFISREKALTEEVQKLRKYREKMRDTTAEKAVFEDSVVKVVELQAQVHSLKQQLHSANQSIMAPDERAAREIEQLRMKVQAATNTERDYVERQIRTSRQIQSLESELQRARAYSDTEGTEIATLKSKIGSLSARLKQKAQEYDELKVLNDTLEISGEILRGQLARSNSQASDLQMAQGFAAVSSIGGSTNEPAKRRRDDAEDEVAGESSRKKCKGEAEDEDEGKDEE